MAVSLLACGRIGIETIGQPAGEFPTRGGAAGSAGSGTVPASGAQPDPQGQGILAAPLEEGKGGVVPTCSWTPSGAPEVVTGLELSGAQYGPALASDALTLTLAEVAGGGVENLFFATRPDRGTVFPAATVIAEINTDDDEGTPFMSYDGWTLFFYSNRPEGLGDRDILFATRPDRSGPFDAPVNVTEVNSDGSEIDPPISADGRVLFFSSVASGSREIWRATRTCG